MTKRTKAQLEDVIESLEGQIENVVRAVMEYPDGCTDGKRDFLKKCGITPPKPAEPLTIAVPLVLTLAVTDEVDTLDTQTVLETIQSVLDEQDWVEGLSTYCGTPVSCGNQDSSTAAGEVVLVAGVPEDQMDAGISIDKERGLIGG